MGYILYDGTTIGFDDRTLTHVQIVIINKFKKQESFLMSWKDDRAVGDGRGSCWLSPTIPIYFKFHGGRVPAIDTDWLLVLGKSAESSTGLVVTDEKGELVTASNIHGGAYPGSIDAGSKK
jgi:hypothetical protein